MARLSSVGALTCILVLVLVVAEGMDIGVECLRRNR